VNVELAFVFLLFGDLAFACRQGVGRWALGDALFLVGVMTRLCEKTISGQLKVKRYGLRLTMCRSLPRAACLFYYE
jgi:hypothetical protein